MHIPTGLPVDVARYYRGLRHRQHKRHVGELLAQRIPESVAYRDLHRSSLGLAEVRTTTTARPSVNLVLVDLAPSLLFAGVNTAVLVAAQLCVELDLPLRIVVLSVSPGRKGLDAISQVLETNFPTLRHTRITYQRNIADESFSANDLWIATFWATAHALDVACRLGLMQPARVVYLIQDYEPSFFPFSTESALAKSTYHAGFTPLVNSKPLADYLGNIEGVEISSTQIFAPQLDLDRLRNAATLRRRADQVRVLFYGRPSKPRNMFSLGLSALRLATRTLEQSGIDITARSAGEAHPPIPLSGRAVLHPLGRLSWDDYFLELARTDVVVSLQATVHPSHPPLDGVVSGAESVTNEVGGTRGNIHELLHATEASPNALAAAIHHAASASVGRPLGEFSPELLSGLGHDLPTAARATLEQVR